MAKVYLLLSCVIALSAGGQAHPPEQTKPLYRPEDYQRHFEEFIKEYGRNYTNEESKMRFEVFKQNLEKINKLNLEHKYATYGINKFADFSKEDYAKLTCVKRLKEHGVCKTKYGASFADVEDASFDWRDHNAVTEVKDQGLCGSCWAFSTIGNVEGQYAIKNKKLMNFSEQQLVQCDMTNLGCGGGYMDVALRDIINKGGVMTADDYSYNFEEDDCKFDKSKVKVSLSDCIVYKTDEEKLKSILKNVGPLAVGMLVGDLLHYKSGVDDTKCPGPGEDYVNHAVLLVGYGTENGVPYWLLKNSWGTHGGDDGYIKLKRGNNTCCILNEEPATGVI